MRTWTLPLILVVLFAAHGFALYRLFSNATLGIAAASGVIVLVLLKHLGLVGWAGKLWRR